MRSWKSLLLITAVLLLVPASAAFANGGWLIDANAGVGIPTSDFGDFWKSGLLVGASASYLVSPKFAVGVDGAYVKNDPSDDYAAALDLISADDQFNFIHYGAHAKYMIPVQGSRVSPYLVGGAGLYSVKEKYEEPGFSEDFTQTAFGLRGGAGMNWMVGTRWGLGFEADYHHVITDEAKIGHDSAPFIGIAAGLHFHLTPSSASSTTE